MLPETLFWSEDEAQSLLDGGETPLEHVWPPIGYLGPYSLARPAVLLAISAAKLVAIGASALGGYRGGFIFPFFFAAVAMGLALSALTSTYIVYVSPTACALGLATALNVAVTKTILATPIVLCEISGRVDVLPCLLVASILALLLSDGTHIIKAARSRVDNDGEHELGRR